MQSTVDQSEVSQIGCVAFGTPNGREVVAQPGVSIAHQDDWVAQAAHAMQFDVSSDTLLMQRIVRPGAIVFWFGVFRYASEINVNRGGYVGFGVWSVNNRLDGERLLRTLTLAAAQVRDMAVTNGKFHTPIRAIAEHFFDGDAAFYGTMLASAQPLASGASMVEVTQQPMVLDVRGSSDAWCAQLINLFQSESGLYTSEALALARSDAVVESAMKLRLWPVVEPIGWLTDPSRSLVQGLRMQLQEVTAAKQQQARVLEDLSKQLSSAEDKAQILSATKYQLVELEKVTEQERLAARHAKQELEDLRHRAGVEFNSLGQRTQSAERLANDRAMELELLHGKLREIRSSPPSQIWSQRQLGSTPSDLKNLERQLENKTALCDQFAIRNTQLIEKNKALEASLDELTEQRQHDSVANHGIGIKATTPMLLQWVAMGLGWLLAMVLTVLLVTSGGADSQMKKLELKFEVERAQLEREVSHLREDSARMEEIFHEVEKSEQMVMKERDALKAQLLTIHTQKQNMPSATKNSEAAIGTRAAQKSRPAANPAQKASAPSSSTMIFDRVPARASQTQED